MNIHVADDKTLSFIYKVSLRKRETADIKTFCLSYKCNCCNNFLYYFNPFFFFGWMDLPHREKRSLCFSAWYIAIRRLILTTPYILFLHELWMWKIKWKVIPPLHFSPDFQLIFFSHISLSNLHVLCQILEMTGRKCCYHYLVDFTELSPLYLITWCSKPKFLLTHAYVFLWEVRNFM